MLTRVINQGEIFNLSKSNKQKVRKELLNDKFKTIFKMSVEKNF